jgi:hypothetical protein
MIDAEKTNSLRKKINQLKEDTIDTRPPEKEQGFVYHLSLFATRFFAVYGAHYYLMKKFGGVPFSIWESFVIFFGFLTLMSLFIKKNK